MRRSRLSSEDHSASKKRTRKESSSSRRDSPDKSNPKSFAKLLIGHRKREEKRDEKKSKKSPTRDRKDASETNHVLTRRMSQH